MYGTLPYTPGPQYTALLPCTAPLPYAAPYVTMSTLSARPAVPMGYYGQGSQVPFVPNPNWMIERELVLQQQPVQVEGNFDSSKRSASATRARPVDQITSKAKAKSARSVSRPRRSPSPKRDYPRGTCTATRPSQASPKRA